MLSYEEQTKKLLSKRDALEKRVREDGAEIDKINAKLNEMQLARVRDTFGLDQKVFFELITQHPEKLLELTAQSAAESDTDTAQDSDEMDGQTSFFDKKRNPYVFHKILDCVSDTAADEMRAAYKTGFKDGVALMIEIKE